MTFLEAVQALKDGQCKGIKRNCMAGFAILNQESNEFGNIYALVWKDGNSRLSHFSTMASQNFLSDDWELVDPLPQTETVEVKRWLCIECGCSQGFIGTNVCCGKELVELTGTYERPVKPKVKRREEIEPRGFYWKSGDKAETIAQRTRFFAEWEE